MESRNPAMIFEENRTLGGLGKTITMVGAVLGVVGIGLGALLGNGQNDHMKHFFHAYLHGFIFVLSISLGALIWITVQHLVKAGWSVVVRRVGEIIAANILTCALLFIPILATVLTGNSVLYPWVDPKIGATLPNAAYLSTGFFVVRAAIYFGFWIFLSQRWLRSSTAQDKSGDPEITRSNSHLAGPCVLLMALTLTFGAIDWIMSMDPRWYSTIFGVIYFAGSWLSFYASMILIHMWFQKTGRLVNTVTVEHYHDLGKLLFAFTFFWGYTSFSQFMLIWYGNIPEETLWFRHRWEGSWKTVSVMLIFMHFVIPFVGLISRHAKRIKPILAFWAVWMLVMHAIEQYWLVFPQLTVDTEQHGSLPFNLINILVFLGVVGIWIAGLGIIAGSRPLVCERDPRLGESLSFKNL